MALKRALLLSLLLVLGAAVAVYALAWGLFSTHAELGMDPASARVIALWAAPIIFCASLIYFTLRNRGR